MTQLYKTKDDKTLVQKYFLKVVGENAAAASELSLGQHIYVEGKLRYSKEANIQYVESMGFRVL